MRRFQRAHSILVMGLRGSCWWAAPQPRLLLRPSLQELVKEGRHMSALHPQLGTAMKNGVIEKLVIRRSVTAAAHLAQGCGAEQETTT
jgi:hypothetical protein